MWRKHREKRGRKQREEEYKASARDRVASILNRQPLLEGFRIMDKTAEEVFAGAQWAKRRPC